MQLESIEVYDLFGRFNYKIAFQLSERITILTAPNGYGKTVLLNLLTYFFKRQYYRMRQHEFSSLELMFSGGSGVRIKRDVENAERPGKKPKIALSFHALGHEKHREYRLEASGDLGSEGTSLERYLPFVTRIDVDRWLDDRTHQIYAYEDLINQYGDHLPKNLQSRVNLPEWLQVLADSVSCHLIETQRLLQLDLDPDPTLRPARRSRSVVERNAEDLSQKIGEALKRYANEAQKLDQSFPKRVIAEFGRNPPVENVVRQRLQELEAKRSKLNDAGLIDRSLAEQITGYDNISQNEIRILLNLYSDDTQAKLSVFDDLYEKISLFQRVIGDHLAYKRISIDARKGMRIIDDNDREVPLNSLSSGEQHELVMIYDLLFRVPDNALILIDEPELSLHVAWQKRFIPDLQEIQRLRSIQVVIATHSPQIINDRWDLTVELGTKHELH